MLPLLLLGTATLTTAFVWAKLHAVLKMFRVDMPELPSESIDSLPTVSLCIPARNETHAMTACLESALLSTYPKLEIIVLDDESGDNTGHLIKSFAHSGVRFVEGSPLPDGWLGKNHALNGLLRESSGSIILFIDVDTRLGANSINQMVAYMLKKDAAMISVLPYQQNTMSANAIFATFRHFWNILGHTTKHPAVASSAWMIRRESIAAELGGLSEVAREVRPELSIAQRLSEKGLYRFIVANHRLDVSYEKRLVSQYETSIRIYYPNFGFGGIAVRVLGLSVLLVPYLMVVIALLSSHYTITLLSFIVTIFISLVNAWYLGVLRSNNYGIASLCLPFIMLREAYLLIASFVLYKRGKVTWKGRPVSLGSRN